MKDSMAMYIRQVSQNRPFDGPILAPILALVDLSERKRRGINGFVLLLSRVQNRLQKVLISDAPHSSMPPL